MIIQNRSIITLDSFQSTLGLVNENLQAQSVLLNTQISELKKSNHQLRIQNMYSAHENDFVIDSNVFENDEI